MGLKMNIAGNMMAVDNTPINVKNVLIENVEGYVYQGQHSSLKENNQTGWDVYVTHRYIFKSNLSICLMRTVYTYWVLPTVQIHEHSPNKHITHLRPNIPQWKEVCSTIIIYNDINTNIWLTERTTVVYIISNVSKHEVVLGRAHQPPHS